MENEKIIEALVICSVECRKSAFLCLKQDNIDELKNCIEINVLTAEICQAAAEMMMVTDCIDTDQSTDTHLVIEQCITQLTLCITECQKHNNKNFVKCVSVCRECIKACEGFIVNILPK